MSSGGKDGGDSRLAFAMDTVSEGALMHQGGLHRSLRALLTRHEVLSSTVETNTCYSYISYILFHYLCSPDVTQMSASWMSSRSPGGQGQLVL